VLGHLHKVQRWEELHLELGASHGSECVLEEEVVQLALSRVAHEACLKLAAQARRGDY